MTVSSSFTIYYQPISNESCVVIEKIYEKGYIHRDISISNVLLDPTGDESRGLLIDYDYAIHRNRAGHTAAGRRTVSPCCTVHYRFSTHCWPLKGTLPFMAIEVLEGESTTVHSYYHDLESLFYVLIWVCTMYSGPRGALRDKTFDYKKSVLSVWNGEMIGMGGHFPIVAWSKRAIMMHPERFNDHILKNFAPYFEPIKEDIEKLCSVLFPTPLSSIAVEVIGKVVGDPKNAESIRQMDPLLLKILRDLLPPSRQEAGDLFAQMRSVLNIAIDRLKKNPPPDPGHTGGAVSLPTAQRYPGIFGIAFNAQHPCDVASMSRVPVRSSRAKRQSNSERHEIAPESPTKKIRSDSSSSSFVLVPRTPSSPFEGGRTLRSQTRAARSQGSRSVPSKESQPPQAGGDNRDDPFIG